jgi:hypothetical protein
MRPAPQSASIRQSDGGGGASAQAPRKHTRPGSQSESSTQAPGGGFGEHAPASQNVFAGQSSSVRQSGVAGGTQAPSWQISSPVHTSPPHGGAGGAHPLEAHGGLGTVAIRLAGDGLQDTHGVLAERALGTVAIVRTRARVRTDAGGRVADLPERTVAVVPAARGGRAGVRRGEAWLRRPAGVGPASGRTFVPPNGGVI